MRDVEEERSVRVRGVRERWYEREEARGKVRGMRRGGEGEVR